MVVVTGNSKYDWVGPWFTPVKFKHYTVPENSANYVDLRGKKGQCLDYFQTSFGHVWAVMMFDGVIRNVRTCYLVASNGDDDKLVETSEASMTPAEKTRYAFTKAGNHGNIANYDQRDV